MFIIDTEPGPKLQHSLVTRFFTKSDPSGILVDLTTYFVTFLTDVWILKLHRGLDGELEDVSVWILAERGVQVFVFFVTVVY